MYTRIETITPARATELLKNNKGNRPLKYRVVASLARDIQNGNFKTTHQGISIGLDGRLLDGQHRLAACVLADTPITVYVTYDMPEELMTFVDAGVSRSFADRASLSGAFRDEPALRDSSTSAMLNELIHENLNSNLRATDPELSAVIGAFHDDVLFVACNRPKGGGGGAAVNAALLAAAICGEPHSGLKSFCRVFSTGACADEREYCVTAVHLLSRYLLSAKAKGMNVGNPKKYNLTQNAIYQFLHSPGPIKLLKESTTPRYPVEEKLRAVLGSPVSPYSEVKAIAKLSREGQK